MQTVLLERMVRTMQDATKISEIELALLDEDVVLLHAIARRVEQSLGKGTLSEDLRHAADRLNALLKRY